MGWFGQFSQVARRYRRSERTLSSQITTISSISGHKGQNFESSHPDKCAPNSTIRAIPSHGPNHHDQRQRGQLTHLP